MKVYIYRDLSYHLILCLSTLFWTVISMVAISIIVMLFIFINPFNIEYLDFSSLSTTPTSQ